MGGEAFRPKDESGVTVSGKNALVSHSREGGPLELPDFFRLFKANFWGGMRDSSSRNYLMK